MFVESFAEGRGVTADAAAGEPGGAATVYRRLMAAAVVTEDGDAAFDLHVLASLLAVAIEEAERGDGGCGEALGLAGAVVGDLLAVRFPTFETRGLDLGGATPTAEIEEEMLRDLLTGHLVQPGEGGAMLAAVLPAAIARRALRPDHLWQDLGLCDRGELNRLLARHFPALHAGNGANMRWKKYFYRKLCEAEGFSLCSAPSCAACADFASCFGAEDGESRMATARRAIEQAGGQ